MLSSITHFIKITRFQEHYEDTTHLFLCICVSCCLTVPLFQQVYSYFSLNVCTSVTIFLSLYQWLSSVCAPSCVLSHVSVCAYLSLPLSPSVSLHQCFVFLCHDLYPSHHLSVYLMHVCFVCTNTCTYLPASIYVHFGLFPSICTWNMSSITN
jgi:hypothetical protein